MKTYQLTLVKHLIDKAPILFRIAQLARPLLFILIIRAINEEIASEFIKYIGLFVILLEIYNIIFPTDRLYLSNATKRDLYYIIQGRLKVSAIILPAGIFYSAFASKIDLANAFTINALILLSSIAICIFSYQYTRTNLKQLVTIEIMSISLFVCSFIVLLSIENIMIGLLLYLIELPIRSILLLKNKCKSFIEIIVKSKSIKFKRVQKFAGLEEGVIVTSYNHVFRLPFTLAHSNLDPLYFIPAQLCSALYNIILSSRGRLINFSPLIAIIIQTILIILLWGFSQNLSGIGLVGTNIGVLTILAIVHSFQLIQIPGRTGIVKNGVGKKILIFAMIVTVISAIFVNSTLVLAAPIILTAVNLKVKHGRDRDR